MKAIQITMDEELLERLDATDEVGREGRSAVLRRAVAEYLQRRRAAVIRERYRKAYGSEGTSDEPSTPLGEDFEGWEEQGSWPEE